MHNHVRKDIKRNFAHTPKSHHLVLITSNNMEKNKYDVQQKHIAIYLYSEVLLHVPVIIMTVVQVPVELLCITKTYIDMKNICNILEPNSFYILLQYLIELRPLSQLLAHLLMFTQTYLHISPRSCPSIVPINSSILMRALFLNYLTLFKVNINKYN